MGKGGDCCTCDLTLPCPGCIEKEKRLTEAVALIRRGVRMLNRTGWEKGETDDEWRQKAVTFLAIHEMETEYLKSQDRKPIA